MSDLDRQYQQSEQTYKQLLAQKLQREGEAAKQAKAEAASAAEVDRYLQKRISLSLLTGTPHSAAIALSIQRSPDQPRAFLSQVYDLLTNPVSGLGRSGTDWTIGSESHSSLAEVQAAIEGMVGASLPAPSAWLSALLPYVLFPEEGVSAANRKAIAVEEALTATDEYPANLTPEDRRLLHRTFGTGSVWDQTIA